jgi:hypothetical protein
MGGGSATSAESPDGEVSLVECTVPPPPRCRCGTRFAESTTALALRGVPDSVRGLFDGKAFCTVGCVRVEFLEMFETLDGMLDSPAEAMLSDLRPSYSELARLFADLAHE